VLVGF
jgi:P-type E1-E2 ATPase